MSEVDAGDLSDLAGAQTKRISNSFNYNEDTSSDDDEIIVKRKPKAPRATSKSSRSRQSSKTATPPDENDDSDDEIIVKKPKIKTKPTKKTSRKNSKSSSKLTPRDSDSDDEIIVKKTKKPSATRKRKSSNPPVTPKKRKLIKEESTSNINESDDAMDMDQLLDEDDGVKWQTLEHQGVYFPPEYIPHGIPLIYNNVQVRLKPNSEEVATFFAGVINTDYQENAVFCANFFDDFKQVLAADGHTNIKEFKKCDFTLIYAHLEELKVKRKSMSKDEKLLIKQEKLLIEEQFGWALVNNKKQKIGNFRLEPPGLFRGRGKHPKTGKLKKRLMPGDVVLNISKDAKIPPNPYNLPWKEIVHNPTVTWLAMWKENINGNFKYVFLSHGSIWKSQSDLKKFEKSRELSKYIETIRKTYNKQLYDKDEEIMQRATALYFIDKLALRAGNEKGDDEADTVGCCSLRVEHVGFKEPDVLVFDFLGKDSIRYYNELTVPLVVYQNLKKLTLDKAPSHDLFDKLTTTSLNKHLQGLMPGLTAKVFRTFNASFTFSNELRKNTRMDMPLNEKILAFNRSNREVAILCNHQKTVSKGHDGQMKKIKDKLLGYAYKQQLIKKELRNSKLEIEKDLLAELTPEWIEEHLELEKELAKGKLVKQHQRHLEKNPDDKMTFEDYKEQKTPSQQKQKTEEQLLKEYEKLKERITTTRTTLLDKDEGKTTSLGTSKQNYIDPRITVSWAKEFQVPIEKMMNKSLLEKFKWALVVDEKWKY